MRLARLLNTSNWKYAFGEVALIVVGVTIALWADAWVEARGAHAAELARLGALHDNVERTVAEIRDARSVLLGASDALHAVVLADPANQDDDKLLDRLRYGLLYGPSFHPEQNIYDDLKNSGELALLSNPALRRALATMDARLELVRYAQADLTSVQQLNVDSYMIGHIDLRWLYESLLGFEDIKADTSPDFGFVGDERFRNVMLLKLDVVTQLGNALESAHLALEEVLALIDAQLET